MHLVYEGMKLCSLYTPALPQMARLLHTLACQLGWGEHAEHYTRDFPELGFGHHAQIEGVWMLRKRARALRVCLD